jgi:hypothetical protein
VGLSNLILKIYTLCDANFLLKKLAQLALNLLLLLLCLVWCQEVFKKRYLFGAKALAHFEKKKITGQH